MIPTEEFIAVGRITNTHGIKGYVKVFPLTDNLERFNQLKLVFLVSDKERHERVIEHVTLNYHKNFAYILFQDISNIDQAELLKNYLIMIPKSQIPVLHGESYYHFQIIGLDVYLTTEEYLGTVKQVLETGANDVYLLEGTTDNKPILIPALKSIVKRIDLEHGKMIIDPPPGLLD